jgi:hypothetical protein
MNTNGKKDFKHDRPVLTYPSGLQVFAEPGARVKAGLHSITYSFWEANCLLSNNKSKATNFRTGGI